MSTTIDERVVEMRFDNKQFESNVQTSLSTLDKLKQSLNLTGATKGLENISETTKSIDMSRLSNAVEIIQSKFSAMSIVGITALTNITNSAVNAGKRIISALTIDPIKTGFAEYETQINAVQTILANTSHAGTDLEDVNKVLDELNEYADKTIYNFTQMTRNIGTFTAAGVDLETSASAIQGIANLAAVSGSTSQQASNAMYQLSQAIANGRVNLQDWNSVVNAGMGGKVFQDALIKTAAAMKGVTEETFRAENVTGSFRESINSQSGTGWLTSDVLVKTLSQFTMAAEKGSKQWNEYKKSLMDEGYTEKQAIEILNMANTATDAATKVKTLTQLWDTLKESAQSGWTQSWEIIMGDFEEAKALLTEVSDTIGSMLGKSAESRNNLLQGWKDLGGRTSLIESLRNTFDGVLSVVEPIKKALTDIFPPATSEQLYKITVNLEKFTEKLTLSSETSSKVERIFKGLFSILDMIGTGITAVTESLFDLSQSEGVRSLADFILDTLASIGDFFTSVNKDFNVDGFTGALSTAVSGISSLLSGTVDGLSGFSNAISLIGDTVLLVIDKIWSPIESVFSWISENITAGDIFAGLAGGGIFMAMKNISDFVDSIMESLDKLFGKDSGMSKWKEVFVETLSAVHDSLEAFTTGLKIWSIVGVAAAITLLSSSLKTISEISVGNVTKSLLAIGIMMSMLVVTLNLMSKRLVSLKPQGLVKAATSMVLVAEAINILADAMTTVAQLKLTEIGKGLLGIGVLLLEISVASKIMSKMRIPLSNSVAVLALAQSCKILGEALGEFSKMSLDEIGRGLKGMGGALAELVVATAVLKKTGGLKSLLGSASLLVMVQGLDDLASALQKFGSMSWDVIERGLKGMGGALAEVGVVTGALGLIAGFSGILGAGSILITIQGLDDLASALGKIGSMSWDEVERGLYGMEEALTTVGVVTGVLGKLGGLSSIIGAGSILMTIQGLDDIANALKKFGSMSWDEIDRGLSAMGDALGEVALGGFLNTLSGLGAMSISEIAEPLGVLADSLKKWKDVTVPEHLGWNLSQLASGVLSFTLGGLGASALATTAPAIGTMADSIKKWKDVTVPKELPKQISSLHNALNGFWSKGIGADVLATAAPAIGTMADSIKKWKDVTVPEGLDEKMKSIADGIKSFSFAFMGGWSLNAVTTPLGELAVSISKWKDVTIPNGLGDGLISLSDGVKAFSWAFMGGLSLDVITGPLGNLADSIKKWNGVSIPSGLSERLSSLADGVKAFIWAFMGGFSLDVIAGPLGDFSDTVKKWNGVSIPKGLGDQLKDFAGGVTAITDISGISDIPEQVSNVADSIAEFSKIGITAINSGLSNFTSALTKMSSTLTTSVTNAVNKVRGYYDDFYTAGYYAVAGFADGITAYTWMAEAEASAMASAALDAAEKVLGIESPSKEFQEVGKWSDMGMVVGLKTYANRVDAAARNVGYGAVDSLRESLTGISTVISSNMLSEPTIRPVLDLSEVKSGMGYIGNMFGGKQTLSVSTSGAAHVTTSMQRLQNRQNSNELLSAISGLQKDIANTPHNVYQINGVSYAEGSDVANAIKTIVRATKIDGRS